MGKPLIAAIVLQYGQWQRTRESVASLLRSTLPPAHIIVVDNASPDDSAQRIGTWLETQGQVAHVGPGDSPAVEKLILLAMERNGGYAAGNNGGIRQAPDMDAYLILNNDASLAPDALEAMWTSLSESSRPGLCGATIVYPAPAGSEPLIQCCAGGATSYITGLSTFTGEGLTLSQAMDLDIHKVERGLNFICGACVMASGEFVRQVGLLDEGFFLYCEEQDWALRAKVHFSLSWARDAICTHVEGASTGWNRRTFEWRSSLRLMRSRLRLARIHHPWRMPTVFMGCLFAAGRLLYKKISPRSTH